MGGEIGATATPDINPSSPIVVEGENYVDTGGIRGGGFEVVSWWGGTLVFAGHNQSDDWGDHIIRMESTGDRDVWQWYLDKFIRSKCNRIVLLVI